MNLKIVSGGQTGVDRAGLEAAVELGLDYGGWAPYGWASEDGGIPIAYREKMQEYRNCGSSGKNYRMRTIANIRDSSATLILADQLPLTGGTKLTKDSAMSIGRSHYVCVMSVSTAKSDVLQWLQQFADLQSQFVLNIAGPRETKSPGVRQRAKDFLVSVLREIIMTDASRSTD